MPSLKKTKQTTVIFDPAIEGGFNVSFPDFPGCVTYGRTLIEAKRMAREILEIWIEELAMTHTVPSKKAIVTRVSLPQSHKQIHRSRYETARRQKAGAHS